MVTKFGMRSGVSGPHFAKMRTPLSRKACHGRILISRDLG